MHRGKTYQGWYTDELYAMAITVNKIIENIQSMRLRTEEEIEFSTANICRICRETFKWCQST